MRVKINDGNEAEGKTTEEEMEKAEEQTDAKLKARTPQSDVGKYRRIRS